MPLFTDERNERKIDKTKKKKGTNKKKNQEKIQNVFFPRFLSVQKKFFQMRKMRDGWSSSLVLFKKIEIVMVRGARCCSRCSTIALQHKHPKTIFAHKHKAIRDALCNDEKKKKQIKAISSESLQSLPFANEKLYIL